eukprot:gb/GECG01012379.1/.p1 GENE.gb/GECG01012379.1/~~gb/GECG01012379.1/.p1  ORF type:complete len:453 (+),score=40.76 gb/GECG01012379.1/:1-1359(+)
MEYEASEIGRQQASAGSDQHHVQEEEDDALGPVKEVVNSEGRKTDSDRFHSCSTDETASDTATRETPRWREPFFILGIVLLLIVNVLWTAASVVVQHIYDTLHFKNFVLLTYMCNAMFVILLPLDYVYQRVVKSNPQCMLMLRKLQGVLGLEPKHHTAVSASATLSHSYFLDPLNKKVMKAAFLISPVWFLAQCTYNWSLSATSVTSNTILSTTSSVFTLAFSVLILKEGLGKWKVLGVLLTVGGSVLVGLADKEDAHGRNTFLGDILCLVSALMYGIYTVSIRYSVPEDGSVRITQLFGFIGLANLLLILPVVIILHVTGVSSVERMSAELFGWIVFKGLVDNVLSDLIWAWAITLTSPTISTVALSLTIPLAMLADLVFKHITPTILLTLGSLISIFGFVSTNVDPPNPEELRTMPGIGEAEASADDATEGEHKRLLSQNGRVRQDSLNS